MKKYIADIITSVRIAGAIALLFIKPLTPAFYIVYTICGVSDAIDGFVARRLGTESTFGSKLDSIADLSFYAAMLYKLLPEVFRLLPLFVLIYAGAVILMRLMVYIVTAILFKHFSSLHTWLNKITGAGVFLVPFAMMLPSPWFMIYALAVITVGLAGTIYEIIVHIRTKQ